MTPRITHADLGWHNLLIAIEATVSHRLSEAYEGGHIEKRRWWLRWSADRQNYLLLHESGGIFGWYWVPR